MSEHQRIINQKLRFSWGNIIAFIALIVTAYFSFMGFTYLSGGNFNIALIGMGCTVVVFAGVFVGAYYLKSVDRKFKKSIFWERILVFGSLPIFIAGMIFMSHFWTVKSRNDVVVEKFNNSINNAKQLFNDYETYADNRIQAYGQNLDTIIATQKTQPLRYRRAGFEDYKESIQRDNMMETLKLQLLSTNYDELKKSAIEWIDKANNGASTWNIFLLGNTEKIKEAINAWHEKLQSYARNKMTNEDIMESVPMFQSEGAQKAIGGIDGLHDDYTSMSFPTVPAIIFGIVLYIMLLTPWLLQERHSKSAQYLVSKSKFSKNKSEIYVSEDAEDDNYTGSFTL